MGGRNGIGQQELLLVHIAIMSYIALCNDHARAQMARHVATERLDVADIREETDVLDPI